MPHKTPELHNLFKAQGTGSKRGWWPQLKQLLIQRSSGNLPLHIMLVILIVLFTVILSSPVPKIYQPGDVATNTIRANHDLQIIDDEATAKARTAAAEKIPLIFKLDDVSPALIEDRAAKIFIKGRDLLTQNQDDLDQKTFDQEMASLKENFFTTFNLGQNSEAWEKLKDNSFSNRIIGQSMSIAVEITSQGLLYGPILYEPSIELSGNRNNQVLIKVLSSGTEYVVPTAASLMDMPSAKHFITIKARMSQTRFSAEEIELIKELTLALLHPNLKFDAGETSRLKQEAMDETPNIFFNIKAGEIIVREGAPITPEIDLKLKALFSLKTPFNWLAKICGLIIVLLVFFCVNIAFTNLTDRVALQQVHPKQHLLLFFLLAMVALMTYGAGLFGSSISWDFYFVGRRTFYYIIPTATAAMLAAIFFGPREASVIALFSAIIANTVASSEDFTIFLYTYNGSIAAIWCLRSMNERGHLIPAAIWVSVINCLTLLGLTLYDDSQWGRQTFYNFCAAATSGFIAGIIASGLVPMVEFVFGFSTNLKLLELGNLDRPLLRELMLSAPGTYHHSVIVGAMAEAAAEAIEANAHLAKVGAYYHDIGKMKKPLYFVENQSGENRHDTLSPSMSALVLISHVKDGVEIAKENHLPTPIIDILEQHHGTSLMSFFYHKAIKMRQDDQPEVNEGDFRYPGPRPKSKEAGLVMLADICEAATRSLSEPTPVKIQTLIRQLTNQVFSDGQLDDCELTVQDISVLIDSFTKILIGIYHHRIAYPSLKTAPAVTSEKEAAPKRDSDDHLPDEPAKNLAAKTA